MNEINSYEENKDEIYDRRNIGGYASKEGIFIPDKYTRYNTDAEFDEDVTLSTIIHEYAHRLRSANSKYGMMFEEGFATIFAEACIIHYKIKEQMKNRETITRPSVYTDTSFEYQKAESQVIAILYVLNQKGMDIDLIGEYIFGDQNVFKQKCIQIFGDEFSRYFEQANSYNDDYTIQEDLLINILKDYICKNGLDLKKYWETNSLLLYNRNSSTLMKSIVAAGETAFKESDKKEYKLCEHNAKTFMDDEQSEREGRITRIRKIVEERYNISGKSKEEIYNILERLCSDYIQGKNSDNKENLILNDEIRRIFPKIEEFIEKFLALRQYTTSSAILENLELENVSYSSIYEYISLQLIIKRAENIFKNCTGREDLMNKIYELQRYEQIMDLNQILPNYTDFVQFINEIKQQIPDEFSKDQIWDYKTIYDKVLNLYITKKMQELTQNKSKEKE